MIVCAQGHMKFFDFSFYCVFLINNNFLEFLLLRANSKIYGRNFIFFLNDMEWKDIIRKLRKATWHLLNTKRIRNRKKIKIKDRRRRSSCEVNEKTSFAPASSISCFLHSVRRKLLFSWAFRFGFSNFACIPYFYSRRFIYLFIFPRKRRNRKERRRKIHDPSSTRFGFTFHFFFLTLE